MLLLLLLLVWFAVLSALFMSLTSLAPRRRALASLASLTSLQQRRHRFGMPLLLYGTAWKANQTASLVATALSRGFAGIDTACQPRHYNEAAVGQALAATAADVGVPLEELVANLFVQTKFTPLDGQDRDKPLPYDAAAPIAEQVVQSFHTSQRQLGLVNFHSFVLHSPYRALADTLEAWNAMAALRDGQLVEHIGISNIYDADQFLEFYNAVETKPRFVQNHLHQRTRHLRPLLPLLAARNVSLQLFWTLSGNRHVLTAPPFVRLAQQHSLSVEQLFYAFLLQRGLHADVPVTILDGTTDAQHMSDDLLVSSSQFDAALLTEADLALIRSLLHDD